MLNAYLIQGLVGVVAKPKRRIDGLEAISGHAKPSSVVERLEKCSDLWILRGPVFIH